MYKVLVFSILLLLAFTKEGFASSSLLQLALSEDPDFKKGLSIYHEISTLWLAKTDEIDREGLAPFKRTLEILSKESFFFNNFLNEEDKEHLLSLVVNQNPKEELRRHALFNRQQYHRPSLFCSLNILENKASFIRLGLKYKSAEELVIHLLRNALFKEQKGGGHAYSMYEERHPLFFIMLRKAVSVQPCDEEMLRFQRLVIQLLWEDPEQMLAFGLNAYLEEEFKNDYSKELK